MNEKSNQNPTEILINDFIKEYSDNNLSLNICEKKFKNKYYLLLEIKPVNLSKYEAIKNKRIIVNLIKYDGINLPKSKLYKCLNRNLKKCKAGKTTNSLIYVLYLKLKFPSIYRKYFNFDETIIILIIMILLFIIGVLWSSYHNIITDNILTR